MKIGRFVVDAHIHCGKKDVAKKDSRIKGISAEVESVDNSEQALFDMDAYGIDMGILLPSFIGTHSEEYADMCRKNRSRFRTHALDTETRLAAVRGTKKWNLNDSLKELDGYFSKDREIYVGIGEFAPGSMGVVRDRPTLRERFMEWCVIAEFCVHWDIPCYIHEFTSFNMEEPFSMMAQVCTKYPTFKLIIAHGGGNKAYEIEKACSLAAGFEHIYLETGYWKAEYYEYGLRNPDIGASKLIWGGGDTGSHLWYPQINHGAVRSESNRVWNNRNNWVWNGRREVDYQPNYYGWACHQIHRLLDLNMCTQDEIDLMVGGNAVRLYKLPVPRGCTFAAGRPDLNLMPREILESNGITQRTGYVWPEDVDFVAGVYKNL
jgi:predicted TIM-barrel fold metal-dependent hydrolase